MKYKIVVDKQSRTNPTSEKREYEVDIEELRAKGDVYDSLIFKVDGTYVIRRLHLSELQVLTILDEPIKEPLENVNIELFEGDNYIYLIDMEGNRFYAEYLIRNEFNEVFATRKEMNSAINLTIQEIDLAVNQKFTNYSTKEEMNASINMKADEITSKVSSTYETKENATTQYSQIKQTTDTINAEVSKKVNEETITGAYLILKINGDTSSGKLSADKIDISANDILNLLAGNAINLTSKNITIASENFNIDKNGNMTCSNANVSGTINATSGKIAGWTINNDSLSCSSSSSSSTLILNLNGYLGKVTLNKSGFFQIIDPDDTKLFRILNERGNINEQSSDLIRLSYGNYTTEIGPTYVNSLSITETSLAEQKKNFEKFSAKAIEILKEIDIYKYNLKCEKDTDKKHIGFVIGDNYNYSKEVTSIDNKGVDNYSFTSLCCKAIQEQQEQIEQQNNLIQSLIERIEKLEAK